MAGPGAGRQLVTTARSGQPVTRTWGRISHAPPGDAARGLGGKDIRLWRTYAGLSVGDESRGK